MFLRGNSVNEVRCWRQYEILHQEPLENGAARGLEGPHQERETNDEFDSKSQRSSCHNGRGKILYAAVIASAGVASALVTIEITDRVRQS
jgi:hypothetical protein